MKTIVIVQCRLSSTRLPEKALYQLDDDVLLGWALKSMHKIKADEYYVACDYDSEEKLSPVVKDNGFKLFAGSKDDVLDRFSRLIEIERPDIVVRATADNPFLFYDAAQESLDLYVSVYYGKADYFTYSGLPHGSGVEIFNAHSLLKAEKMTDSPYDHEHVGPSLYHHPENFKSIFYPAPAKYNYPSLRTTVDTYADYLRAGDVINKLNEKGKERPYSSNDVISSLSEPEISKKILFVPSIKKGQGTGHLRRCLELAQKTKGALYIGDVSEETIDYSSFIRQIDEKKIIRKMPLKDEYDLIVIDKFKMTEDEAECFTSLGKTVFIDEGSSFTDDADFLLDIIPSDLKREGNFSNPLFIPAPENKKASYPLEEKIKKILVCFGGEDPAFLTEKVVLSLTDKAFTETFNNDIHVTVITSRKEKIAQLISENEKINFTLVDSISNLKEHLWEYDVVITHYGFTAFECIYSNTPVLLCATSKLHQKLSEKNGFKCLPKDKINAANLSKYLTLKVLLMNEFKFEENQEKDLAQYTLNLAMASVYRCPVCRTAGSRKDILVQRTKHHTFRRCRKCSMVYISFSDDSESVKYEKSYFADEYKKQYGKTYLEDFESIKKSCVSRVKNIDKVCSSKNGTGKNILDIGCAYGPFLSAANDDGWTPFGSDIATDAIDYVKNELKFKATNASFADIDLNKEFGIDKLDAVTMWYVIEHIKDLKSTLSLVNKMLAKGGVFAFSTPNASGLSCKVNKKSFYTQSPKDHYSLWELKNTSRYLKRFGFKVCRIVPSGIHPERHPFIKKHNFGPDTIVFKIFKFLIKCLKNGDTYEVYCKKINGINDEQ